MVGEGEGIARREPVASPEAPHASQRRWRVWAWIAGLAGLYIFLSGLSGLLDLNPTDLDAFFLPAARFALAGHPLQVYSLRYGSYDLVYTNANGPLSLVPLTAAAALAKHLGWLNDSHLRRILIMAVFAPFSLLMAWEGVAAIDRLRGTALRGVGRVLTYGLFLCAPTLWHGWLLYGHVELPIMLWLVLFAVRTLNDGHPGQAGVALGLAMLDRSMAVLYLAPLALLLVARWRWKAATWLGGSGAATVALALLPLWLADGKDLLFSLVTFRGPLPVGGGSVWMVTVGTRFESFAQHYDTASVLVAGVLVSAAVVFARRDLMPGGRDVYCLLAIAGLCFPLLIKTTWPYYFLDAYVLLAIWWLGGARAWRPRLRWAGMLLPAAFVGCALLAEYGVSQDLDLAARQHESLAMAVLLSVCILTFGGWLIVRGNRPGTRGAGESASAPTKSLVGQPQEAGIV